MKPFIRPLVWCALLSVIPAACSGGGGGGTAVPTVAPFTPSPLPTLGGSGFVAASGSITILPGASGGFGSTVLAGSPAAQFIVQSASQPGSQTSASAIAQFPVTVTQTAGLSASDIGRANSPRLPDMRAAHQAAAADGLHELPPAQIGVEPILRTLTRLPESMRGSLAVRSVKANVGDQRNFKVLYQQIGGIATTCPNPVPNYTCYVNVTATLKAIGSHGYVWVDNASLANPNEFPDSSYFATTATNFDSYFAIETQTYGPAFATANAGQYQQCDSNGNQLPQSQFEPIPDMTGSDPHISILITDALAGTGEGGYFYSGNFFAQNILNCSSAPRAVSNELPMVIIGSDNYATGPSLPQYNPGYWLGTDMPRSLSHELQHLLHNMDKYYTRLATNQQPALDDAWIDEGCSMLAEDIAANGIQIDTPRYSFSYLLEPSAFSLTSFVGYQPNPVTGLGAYGYYYYTAGNYGAAYLFLRYVYDRFGGSGAMHAIYSDFRGGSAGLSNVNPVLAAAGNEPWQQLFGEWAIAISAQSSGITTDPRYGLNPAVVLRGAVQIPSRRSAPFQIRNLTFGGPQPPEIFDSGGNPTGYVSLSPSSSPTIKALDGAVNFFIPGPVPGGSTVRSQTGGLNAGQGAMTQGNMPTPMPTSF